MQLPGIDCLERNQLFALHEVEIVIYNKTIEYIICKIAMKCNVIINRKTLLEKNIKSFTHRHTPLFFSPRIPLDLFMSLSADQRARSSKIESKTDITKNLSLF